MPAQPMPRDQGAMLTPQSNTIGMSGCPPSEFADGAITANHSWVASHTPLGMPARPTPGDPDAMLAYEMQISEMRKAEAEMEEEHETRAAIQAVMSIESAMSIEKQKLLYDPLWGELRYGGTLPSMWDRALFGCCPLCVVGCGFRGPCCVSGDATAQLTPMQGWKRVLKSSAMWISLLQVAIFILVIVDAGGFTAIDKNPMLGPHHHHLSFVGAKNTAKIIYENEWWRLLSAPNLHGGVFHLLMNIFCQLKFGMLVEVYWGPFIFQLVYWISGIYSMVASSIFIPNALSVGSSGAICGLIGADLVFVGLTWRQTMPSDIPERNAQFFALVISVVITGGISCLPLVDFAAHGGGFVVGVLLGFTLFTNRRVECSPCMSFACQCVSAFTLLLLIAGSVAYCVLELEPDPLLLKLCRPSQTGCN